MKRKEIIWLIGSIILILIFNYSLLGKDSLNLDSVTDINIDDIMIVLPKIYLFVLFSVLLFFGIYLIRMLRRNFKNRTVNLLFLVACILLTLVISKMISISDSFNQSAKIAVSSEGINNIGNGYEIFSNGLVITQIVLLILIVYSGIKTGMNYKNK